MERIIEWVYLVSFLILAPLALIVASLAFLVWYPTRYIFRKVRSERAPN
jgi:hypothetical protein